MVAEHEALLNGFTVERLPEAVGNLKALASSVNNPKGLLLNPEQRTARAAFLLGAAFGLILVERGWEVCSAPAELYLKRGENAMNPFAIVARFRKETPNATWASEFGVQDLAGVLLGSAGKSSNLTGAERPVITREN